MTTLLATTGLRARTGGYAAEPVDLDALYAAATSMQIVPTDGAPDAPKMHTVYGVDSDDLAQAGWAVVFPQDEHSAAIREALAPLLELRRRQAGPRYRECFGRDGIARGESKRAFLARHGVGAGPVDPALFPYYVLLVGDPERVDFAFQYLLDVNYAVGRLDFALDDGTPDIAAYGAYAHRVAMQETEGTHATEHRNAHADAASILFFGPCSPDDAATELSSHELIRPLGERLRTRTDRPVDVLLGSEATKGALDRRLRSDPPALLFSAGHGLVFESGDPQQRPHQGALVCSDWPGPEEWQAPIPETFYYSRDDLSSEPGVDFDGMSAFLFACFGLGTPRHNEFATRGASGPTRNAQRPFTSQLPQAMLRRGASAVIGHVDLAWDYSFRTDRKEQQLQAFESVLRRLADGGTFGAAMEDFNTRAAALAMELVVERDHARFTRSDLVDRASLVALWTAYLDARNYVVLGDPAVRLRGGI